MSTVTPPTENADATKVVPPVATPDAVVTPPEQKPDATVVDPAAVKVADEKVTPKPDAAAVVVPEKYELKLPADSTLDESNLVEIGEFAKANKLSNEQAQAILEREAAGLTNWAQAHVQHHNQIVEGWKAANLKDPELGGPNAKENAELVHRLFKAHASPELMKEMEESGYGHHTELNRFLLRIAKQGGEKALHIPGFTGTSKSDKELFYGKKEE